MNPDRSTKLRSPDCMQMYLCKKAIYICISRERDACAFSTGECITTTMAIIERYATCRRNIQQRESRVMYPTFPRVSARSAE